MRIRLCLIIFHVCLWYSLAHADGNYVIGRDSGGVYFETDGGNSWYLSRQDLKYFKIGQRGTYTIKKDSGGTYIVTDNQGKFYVGSKFIPSGGGESSPASPEISDAHPGQKEMKVIIKGNQILVPVQIKNQYKKEEVLLLLDTGASIVILHQDVADKLKLTPIKKERVLVVGGNTVPMTLVELADVSAGSLQKKKVLAGVIEHKGGPVSYQGLLGMSFLKGVKYHVDFDRQILRWD